MSPCSTGILRERDVPPASNRRESPIRPKTNTQSTTADLCVPSRTSCSNRLGPDPDAPIKIPNLLNTKRTKGREEFLRAVVLRWIHSRSRIWPSSGPLRPSREKRIDIVLKCRAVACRRAECRHKPLIPDQVMYAEHDDLRVALLSCVRNSPFSGGRN